MAVNGSSNQVNDPSNQLFQLAVQFVNQTGKHLFLTGKAGTGKTTFLKYIKENAFKKMAVVAPTGVAAINAGGVTMHSFFQLPFGPFVPSQRSGWNEQQSVTDQHSLFKNIRFNSEKRQLLQELEMIIIDEVSMLRADMLDAIDLILRNFRRQPLLPYGGVQMIFIGDLFQLPPVVNNEEWEILKDYYKSPFFFDAQVVQQSPPVYLELKKIYRQSEAVFISILNNIRNNQATRSDLEHLHSYYKPGFQPDKDDNYIILTSHNAKADFINRRELEKLEGKTQAYMAEITGDFSEKAHPADMKLQLKQGAQIMFLKNDKGENRRYFNGKIGQVAKMTASSILVKFPDEPGEVEIEKETWKNIRYRFHQEKNKIEEEELGTFTQYPIRLAWAITIHKSQGLTFTKAIIDAGASFAAGQVYVALSRLTALDGLILYSRIHPESISTDERVLGYTQNEKEETILQSLLQEEQSLFISRMLVQSFEWTKLVTTLENFIDGYPERTVPAKDMAINWAGQLLRTTLQQQEVARKFTVQLDQLLAGIADDDYTNLHSRTTAAAAYFKESLQKMSVATVFHIKEYTPKPKVKKYIRELEALNGAFLQKNQELAQAVQMAEGLMNGGDMSVFFADLQKTVIDPALKEETTAKLPSKEKKGATKLISLEMFLEGKTIPDIAATRGMVISTIEGHLASFLETGEVAIEQLVSKEKIKVILEAIDESPGNTLYATRDKLGPGYSFGEIRSVSAYRAVRQKEKPVV